ncbi:MAG: hypothetical protein JSV52_08655 [Candidatus Zixiibacteriota bacterium]|nr:MAG: hypothetical protein JSV52_08655 [candidate division Zixibacteria bacterium]
MKTLSKVVLALILTIGLALPAIADTPGDTDKNGALTVPWDEFKILLDLDADKIIMSVETFHKLLAQTGLKYPPTHLIREGNVVLTRAQFESIVSQMKAPVDGATGRPVDYLITKATYDGKMNTFSTSFTGTFKIHVLKDDAYVKIPVIPMAIPLEDITVDGKPALVISEGGYHTIVLSKAGQYTVETSFSLASSLDKGPNKIDLAIAQTPITLLTLELPLKDIDVEIPQAQQVLTKPVGNKTVVKAAIATGNNFSIRWRKKVEQIEKIPAKLHADLYHLLSIEDGAIVINTDVSLNILHSEIDAVRLLIPDNLNVLAVSGEGIGEWQELTQDKRKYILVPFTYGKKGSATIRITSEIPATETGMANAFSGIRVDAAVRETGYIGVVLNTSAEVTVADSDGLEIVAAQKLPRQIVSKSPKPLTMGFKYLKHPYSLVLDVKKHDKVAVPVATINSANVVTLFTEDGKIVHRLVYQVKNSAKQFLQIRMPSEADVWSVLVDNQPVESSVNDKGELLVPLIRSRQNGNNLQTFPVEVIYAVVQEKFDWLGSRGSTLPAVDLMISQIMWSVYLPNDYTYHHFSSSLEIEQMARGVNIFAGAKRQYNEQMMRELARSDAIELDALAPDKLKGVYGDEEYESRFRNIPMPAESQKAQIIREIEFGGTISKEAISTVPNSLGVLPIQIQVPTSGQVYRFARTIINSDDPLTFEVTYSRDWAAGMLKWVLIVLGLVIVWLSRRKFQKPWRWLKESIKTTVEIIRKNRAAIERAAKSTMTPFVLFGLAVVSMTVSVTPALVFFLLFWMSAAYHVMNFRKRKLAERAKLRAGRAQEATDK